MSGKDGTDSIQYESGDQTLFLVSTGGAERDVGAGSNECLSFILHSDCDFDFKDH